MKALPAILVVGISFAASTGAGWALPARMVASLKKMDPGTRFEQRCNIEAMNRIHAADARMRPSELVTYAFGQPDVDGDVMVASGAAFRSHGKWRHLWFRCKTDGSRMNVLSFRYKIGAVVPRKKWSKHYLVPE